jgi:hemoglobin/transferrin/lactoferrin receptor protein
VTDQQVGASQPGLLGWSARSCICGRFGARSTLGDDFMRDVSKAAARSTRLVASAVVSCGLSCGAAFAQESAAEPAAELPPLQVTAKQGKKKKAAVAKPAAVSAPAEAAPAPVQPVEGTKVSGEPRIGTNTTNITSQDLARINATDVQDVFSGQPGIIVGSSIPMSQKVYVNGIEETNLAVTVDGATQNNKVFHHSATNFVDPSLLKAVRVDAGVAPADAGFGALAGSIAYETKDVGDLLDRDGFGGFSKNQFNTNGDVFTNNIAAYGMSKGFEILGSFNIGRGNEFEAGDGSMVPGTETHFESGLGKLAYQAPSGDRFEVSHDFLSDDALRPYRANFVYNVGLEPVVVPYDINRQTTVFNYSDATPQGWWDPKIVLAHSKTSVDKPFVHPRRPNFITPIYGDAESFNGKFENKFSFANGNVIAGVDFVDSETAIAFDLESYREKSTVVGGYAQARLEPVKGTRVSFGGRSDHQEFTGIDQTKWNDSGLSGNVSAEQDLFGRFLTAKAGYSHIWAGVALEEAYTVDVMTYNGNLAAAIADNYTAGLVARYGGWTFDGTVFRTEIADARVKALLHDVETEGFELGARYDWSAGFLRVAYANIDASIDGKPADAYNGYYLTTPVGERITITGVHTFVGTGFTVGADAVIAPSYDRVAAGSGPLPAYEVFNAFVEYKPQVPFDLTLRLDVRNILDEMYADRASYGQEWLNDPLDPTVPLFEPGRSFLLTATSKF